MSAQAVVQGLWRVPLGFVNTYLLETPEGLMLIDAGMPGHAPKILAALQALGRRPADIRQILVTHCHADHSGSLAELKRQTGSPAAMHREDARMVREGQARRPFQPAPGIFDALIYRVFVAAAPTGIEPAAIEQEIDDGATLPGGLRAIHVPGHCAGQLAFHWPEHRGVLIAADAASHAIRLALSPVYENLEEGRRSLSKLARLDFEVACFGHGKPILNGAAAEFRKLWPPLPASVSQAN